MITLANHRCCILLMATLLASYYLPEARGYEFDMIFQTKCIFEEVYDSAVTLAGKYEAFNRDNVGQPVEVSVRIENPHGEQLYEQKGQSKGDFKLVSTTEGDYKVCFTTKDYHTAQNTRISFEWKEGAEATDWTAVAKKDNLDKIHTEMVRLEDMVHTMHLELQHIRRKEEIMRDVNEKINARVAWFSIGAMLVCVGSAALQLWSLRKFFVRKKVL